jgi:signal peptidase II
MLSPVLNNKKRTVPVMLLSVIAVVLLADQFSKFLIRDLLLFGQSIPATGFFRFTHVYNTGSLFGIFQGYNFPLILASALAVGLLIWIYKSYSNKGTLIKLSLGLQLGGALGNLSDRLWLGHVTDFIDIGIWPVFNIADSSIVVGLFILGFLVLTEKSESSS